MPRWPVRFGKTQKLRGKNSIAGARRSLVQEDGSKPAAFTDGTFSAVVPKVTDLSIVWPSPVVLAELI
jgi:hypothetical protein